MAILRALLIEGGQRALAPTEKEDSYVFRLSHKQ